MTQMCYYAPVVALSWFGTVPVLLFTSGHGEVMLEQQTLRIEIERLDHGYEATVPSIDSLRCVGLTENETLNRLSRAAAAHFQVETVLLEVFRT